MCGILAALGLTGDVETNRRMMLRLSKLLRHRGPDSNMIDIIEEHGVYMCHERLNIVDISDAGRCVPPSASRSSSLVRSVLIIPNRLIAH